MVDIKLGEYGIGLDVLAVAGKNIIKPFWRKSPICVSFYLCVDPPNRPVHSLDNPQPFARKGIFAAVPIMGFGLAHGGG